MTQRKLRFWHQSMTELDGLTNYGNSIQEHFKNVMGSEASIEIHGLKSGSYYGRSPTAALANAYVYHRALEQIISNAIVAQRDGYDAFIIGSFSEPYLREIRSVVDIPVVSILESSILVGCSLGKKLAAIANAPEIALIVEDAVEGHGLSGRVTKVVSLSPAWYEPDLAGAYDHADELKEAFISVATNCIDSGAEVIIPAEGVLAAFLSKYGVKAINGAPIIDVFALTWRYAVMLVRLRDQIGLKITEVGSYSKQDKELIALISSQN